MGHTSSRYAPCVFSPQCFKVFTVPASHARSRLCDGHFSWMSLTAEYFSNPAAEMLQEKVSAVPDGCTSRIQAGADEDLLSEQPRLGLSAAPSIPSSSDPDQVVHTATTQRSIKIDSEAAETRCSESYFILKFDRKILMENSFSVESTNKPRHLNTSCAFFC